MQWKYKHQFIRVLLVRLAFISWVCVLSKEKDAQQAKWENKLFKFLAVRGMVLSLYILTPPETI